MSDIDLLRRAADTQDDFGEGAAIAEVLRAVADEKRPMPTRVVDAALSLARAVLADD